MGDISASIGNTGLKAFLFSNIHENVLCIPHFGVSEVKLRPSLVFQSFRASSDAEDFLITQCLLNLS